MLLREFSRPLEAVGLLDQAAPDRWANGEALAELKSSREKTFYEIVQNHAEGEKRMTFELSENAASLANKSEIINIRFIADTGASLHLVDRGSLTEEQRKRIRKATKATALNTANGLVWSSELINLYIKELDITLTALVLDSTVPVLSIGLLIKQNGFGFVWRKGSGPYLQKGTNPRRKCWVSNEIPFIVSACQVVTDPHFPGHRTGR